MFSLRGQLNRCGKLSSVSKPSHSSAFPTLKTGALCLSTAGIKYAAIHPHRLDCIHSSFIQELKKPLIYTLYSVFLYKLN